MIPSGAAARLSRGIWALVPAVCHHRVHRANRSFCGRAADGGPARTAIAGSRRAHSQCRAGSACGLGDRARTRRASSGVTIPPSARSSTSSQDLPPGQTGRGKSVTVSARNPCWLWSRSSWSVREVTIRFLLRIVIYRPGSTGGTSARHMPACRNRSASPRHSRLPPPLAAASPLANSACAEQQTVSRASTAPMPGAGFPYRLARPGHAVRRCSARGGAARNGAGRCARMALSTSSNRADGKAPGPSTGSRQPLDWHPRMAAWGGELHTDAYPAARSVLSTGHRRRGAPRFQPREHPRCPGA